jgi:hypothetical protein
MARGSRTGGAQTVAGGPGGNGASRARVPESQQAQALDAGGRPQTAARLKRRQADVAFAGDRLYGSCAAPGVTVTCDPML